MNMESFFHLPRTILPSPLNNYVQCCFRPKRAKSRLQFPNVSALIELLPASHWQAIHNLGKRSKRPLSLINVVEYFWWGKKGLATSHCTSKRNHNCSFIKFILPQAAQKENIRRKMPNTRQDLNPRPQNFFAFKVWFLPLRYSRCPCSGLSSGLMMNAIMPLD